MAAPGCGVQLALAVAVALLFAGPVGAASDLPPVLFTPGALPPFLFAYRLLSLTKRAHCRLRRQSAAGASLFVGRTAPLPSLHHASEQLVRAVLLLWRGLHTASELHAVLDRSHALCVRAAEQHLSLTAGRGNRAAATRRHRSAHECKLSIFVVEGNRREQGRGGRRYHPNECDG